MDTTELKMPRIFTRNEPTVLRLFPALAAEIGLNESLLLLQIDFLISISSENGQPIVRDNRFWTRQSLRDLQKEYFPFWSPQTIARALWSLRDKDLIAVTDEYNKHGYDKSQWIALNPQGFGWLTSITTDMVQSNGTGLFQNGTGLFQNGTTIPESNRDLINSSVRDEPKYKDLQNEVIGVCKRLNALALKESDYVAVDKLYAMNISPKTLREHYSGDKCWWRLVFWKGKKGNYPTPNDLVDTVGQALAFQKDGKQLPTTGKTKQAKQRDKTGDYLRDNPSLVEEEETWKL